MNDKTQKFLVIDDKNENIITLKALIKESFPGSLILTAQSGKDGLQLAHEQEPDVILLDIMMPDMDGYEVCRIIKTDPVLQDVPVVFVTALISDKETRIKAIENGAEAFIHKPIDKLDLFIQLRTLLKLKEYYVKKKEKINSLEVNLKVKDQENIRILSNLQDAYFQADLSGNFTIVNPRAVIMYGCQSVDEILGQPAQMLYANPKDREKLFEELKSKGFVEDFICKGLRKNGTTFWASMNAQYVKDDSGNITGTEGVVRDISERKQAEKNLQQTTKMLLESQKIGGLGSYELDIAAGMFKATKVMLELFGIEEQRDVSVEEWASIIHPDDRAMMMDYLMGEVIQQGNPVDKQFRVVRINDNATLWLHALGKLEYDAEGNPIKLIGTSQDITERKLADEALREREEFFRSSFESTIAGICMVDLDGKFAQVNKQFCEILGYPEEELLLMSFQDVTYPEDQAIGFEYHEQMRSGKIHNCSFEKRYIRKGGETIWVFLSSSPIRDSDNNCLYFVTYVQDVTERKLSVERMHIREERYRSLVESQLDLITRSDVNGNFTYINQAYCKAFGKSQEELIGTHFLNNVLPDDREIAQELHNSLFDPPHRYSVENRSVTTNGLRWLRWEGSVIRDKDGEIIELQGVGTNITDQKQSEIELQNSVEHLKKSFEGTIETIIRIVEAKDPYTSGHQRRVAEFSVAIANQMGLPKDQLQGIYYAGLIHDVGKIKIPTEILTKPGKLSDIEFGLIKTHSQVGFEMLKDIEFPWPIAKIILQHHEKMDGSGYPNGLKGDEIMVEARIIIVADIIEAMSSHRPYRSALGIEKALEQIKMDRGTLLDPTVVNASLVLFEKGYSFPKV